MVVSGFTFIRSLTVVAGMVEVVLGATTLTAELITSLTPLVVEALELSAEVVDEFAELFAEALAEVSISVDDDAPVEEASEALSEGTTAELIGSPAEPVVEASELVTVESVDEACEDPTEVDDAPLVEG